jgi:hypothetical protein
VTRAEDNGQIPGRGDIFRTVCGMRSNSIESKQAAREMSLLCGLFALL